MPTVNLSPKARLALYLVAAVGTIVAGYLFNKGYIGPEEVALWGGFVALANGLAALNVPTQQGDPALRPYRRRDSGHVDLAVVLLVGILVVLVLALTGFIR